MTTQQYGARRSETEAPGAGNPANGVTRALYHSEQAMEAARKMRRTRQKRKTGHIICQHLRMMLESGNTLAPGPSSGYHKHQYRLGF